MSEQPKSLKRFGLLAIGLVILLLGVANIDELTGQAVGGEGDMEMGGCGGEYDEAALSHAAMQDKQALEGVNLDEDSDTLDDGGYDGSEVDASRPIKEIKYRCKSVFGDHYEHLCNPLSPRSSCLANTNECPGCNGPEKQGRSMCNWYAYELPRGAEAEGYEVDAAPDGP